MTQFATADLHFDHAAIMESCKRPFKSTTVMDKKLVRNWNEVVSPEDWVYIAGDLSLMGAHRKGTYELILRKLNGNKVLIGGNHDQQKHSFYAGDSGVGFVQFAFPFLEVDEFIITHDPALACVRPETTWLIGHVHNHWRASTNSYDGRIMGNCYNVGVDVNDFRPVSFDHIRTTMKQYKEEYKIEH